MHSNSGYFLINHTALESKTINFCSNKKTENNFSNKIKKTIMCSSSHIWCVEIFDEPRNCCRTWNILVVVFLNCSCEINFKAPSRYRKGCVIRKKIFHSYSFFFLTQQKIIKVNKQSSSMKISRFDVNFYASNMRWRAHK